MYVPFGNIYLFIANVPSLYGVQLLSYVCTYRAVRLYKLRII